MLLRKTFSNAVISCKILAVSIEDLEKYSKAKSDLK